MYFPSIAERLKPLLDYKQKVKDETEITKIIGELKAFFDKMQTPQKIRCAIVGKQGVGKSTLVHAIQESDKTKNFKDELAFSEHTLVAISDFRQCKSMVAVNDLLVYVADCTDYASEGTSGLNAEEKQAIGVLVECAVGRNILFVVNKCDKYDRNTRDRATRCISYYLQKLDRQFPLLLFSAGQTDISEQNAESFAWMQGALLDHFVGIFRERSKYLHPVWLREMLVLSSQLQKNISQAIPEAAGLLEEKRYRLQKDRELCMQKCLETLKKILETQTNKIVEEWRQNSVSAIERYCLAFSVFKDKPDVEKFCNELCKHNEKLCQQNAKGLSDSLEEAVKQTGKLFSHPPYEQQLASIIRLDGEMPRPRSYSKREFGSIVSAIGIVTAIAGWEIYQGSTRYLYIAHCGYAGIATLSCGLYVWHLYAKGKDHKAFLSQMESLCDRSKQKMRGGLEHFCDDLFALAEQHWRNYLAQNQETPVAAAASEELRDMLPVAEKLQEQLTRELAYFR